MAVLSDDMGGITAYAAAVNRGYTGTKEEFEQLMYSYTEVAERAEAAAGNAHESEENSIEAKDIAVSAKNEAVSARDVAQSARDASISAKNNSESARDAAISAKDDTLAAKDAVMSAKSSVDETSANFSDEVTAAISDVNAAGRNQKELAKTHAIDSEAWAVGQREGADVGVSDTTYHNNSKYYAEQSALAKSETESARDTAITAKDDAISAKNEAETAKGEAQDIVDGINAKSEQIDQNAEDISDLKSEFTALESDGVVPSAEQILSDKGVTDSVPYHFRMTASDNADREELEIVGGSVAWNQQLDTIVNGGTLNEITYTVSNGKITVTGTATGGVNINYDKMLIPYKADHVYLFIGATGGSSATYQNTVTGYNQYFNGNAIYKPSTSKTEHFRLNVVSGATVNITVTPQIFDLTQMFGTTIADYVYSLETATAGAGVEWLKAHFPRIFNAGYIPYNAGELVSVQASAHKMVGFNQWDEEWELGTYNGTTGEKVTYNSCIRSKNAIRCFPSTNYYVPQVTGGFYLFYYDANGNYIGNGLAGAGIFQTPSNAHQIRFRLDASYGTTYKGDICINLSDPAKNGTYEPYEEHSYPLDDSLELRGLPKLDADNNLVYDGDVYESTGKVTRRYGIVDLGTLTWYVNATGTNTRLYYANRNDAKPAAGNIVANAVCPFAETKNINELWGDDLKGVGVSGNGVLAVRGAIMEPSEFKAAMSGVMLVYELATPTTESAQPFTNPQVVDASGTEEYVTDSVVPVGHVTKYVENLKAKLESAPASPTEDGDYIVRQTDGVNEYVPLEDAPAITAKADVTDLLKAFPTDTASGSIASFSDGAELPIKSLTVDIEPIQDLNGYDNPWPAGGGKNLLNPVVYEGFPKTLNGITTVLNSDGTFTLNGTANARTYIGLATMDFNANTILNGCPSGGSSNTYVLSVDGTSIADIGSGYTITEAVTAGKLMIVIGNGYVCNNLVFKPMVRLSSVSDATFAPYSNICPISGHTQAVVTRTGVNVWDEEWEVGGYAGATGNPWETNTRIRSKTTNYISVFPGTNYYAYMPSGTGMYLDIMFYDADKAFVSSTSATANNRTFTTPNNARFMRFATSAAYGTTYNHDICINYPATDTAYHEGHVQSINISLGQTVYGGTLDVTKGELVIDRAMQELDGSGTIAMGHAGSGDAAFRYFQWGNDYAVDTNVWETDVIANFLVTITGGRGARVQYNALKCPRIIVPESGSLFETVEDLKAYLNETHLTIVYPLATPITVTLTPNELSTLLGANNIWSDAGEVTAEYRADPTLFIQRKIAEALS